MGGEKNEVEELSSNIIREVGRSKYSFHVISRPSQCPDLDNKHCSGATTEWCVVQWYMKYEPLHCHQLPPLLSLHNSAVNIPLQWQF